ncbi:MAG: transcription elongation factor GreB [Gammaproteobacteria bacterium]|nr:transcription elongation factor GreB [Gammaproteobacteria bacterium]
MSRWRAPQPPATPCITSAGYRALEIELKSLWQRRAEVVRHLAAAAAEGDRSENAEYQYRKKELRGIDGRLGYLQRRMPTLKIVTSAPADPARVFFGATVELLSALGAPLVYRLVGSDEIDAAGGDISVDSPLARALLGQVLAAEILVPGLAGAMTAYRIEAIRYELAPHANH